MHQKYEFEYSPCYKHVFHSHISGLLGVLVEPFFAKDEGIFYRGNTLEPWKQLGVNCLGAIAIIAWSAFWSFLLFGILKSHNLLRVDEHTEVLGNDLLHHGEAAYPIDAWLEYQYETQPTEKTTMVDRVMAKLKHLTNETPIENSSSDEKGKNLSELREGIEVQKEFSVQSSNGAEKQASNILTVDGNIGHGTSPSMSKTINRLRQSSSVTIQSSIDGEVNTGYVEEVSVYSENPLSKRWRTTSTTTQTTNTDCVRYTNATGTIDVINTLEPIDATDELVDGKRSFDTISLRSIAV